MNSINHYRCVNTECSLYKSFYQEIVAKALNFTCPSCTKNLEFKKELDWNTSIIGDSKFWNEDVFNSFPTLISYEYWRLYDLVLNNKVYAAHIQLKDVFEIILKLPVLLYCSLIYQKQHREDFQNEILLNILNKRLSLGDWERIARQIINKNDAENSCINNVLHCTLTLYSNCKIVNWRNNTIGHGALGFEDDTEIRDDFENKLISINKYFSNCKKHYANISLYLTSVNNNFQLLGKEVLTGIVFDNARITAQICNNTYDLAPYFIAKYDKIYMFDSFNCWVELSYFLNYSYGKKHNDKVPELNNLYNYLVKNTNLKVFESKTLDNTYTFFEYNAFKNLSSIDDFQRLTFVEEWLENCFKNFKKGIFLLQMDRGTGKTTFSKALDQHSLNIVSFDDFSTRAFYFNENFGFKNANFISHLDDSFRCDRNGKLVICGQTPITNFQGEGTEIQFSDFLNFYQEQYIRYYDTEKLLIVLDGLDEIPNLDFNVQKNIFDLLPNENLLNDGVYILLTCRSETEVSKRFQEKLSRLQIKESCCVNKENLSNIEFLKNYLNKYNFNEELNSYILNKCDHRILYLKPICKLLDYNKIQVTNIPDGSELFSCFLKVLSDSYDNKYYEEFLNILLVLTTSYTPLTIKEICRLLDEEEPTFRTLAYFVDLGGFLSSDRSPRGNLFQVAHEEFRCYLKKTFEERLKQLTEEWILKCEIACNNIEPDDFGSVYLISFLSEYSITYKGERLKLLLNEDYCRKLHKLSKRINLSCQSDTFLSLCKINLFNQILEGMDSQKRLLDYKEIILNCDRAIIQEVIQKRLNLRDRSLKMIVDNAVVDYDPKYYFFYKTLAVELYRSQDFENAIKITNLLFSIHKNFMELVNLILMYKGTDVIINGESGMIYAKRIIEKEISEDSTKNISSQDKAFLYYTLGRIYGDTIENLEDSNKYLFISKSLFIGNNDFHNSSIVDHSIALVLDEFGDIDKSFNILNDLYKKSDSSGFLKNKYVKDAFMLNYKMISFIKKKFDEVFVNEDEIYSYEVLQYFYNNMFIIKILENDFALAEKYLKLCENSISKHGGVYSKAAMLNNRFFISRNRNDLVNAKKIAGETNYSLGGTIVDFNLGVINNHRIHKGFIEFDNFRFWPCFKNIDLII